MAWRLIGAKLSIEPMQQNYQLGSWEQKAVEDEWKLTIFK